ncbi:MAG: NAD(P)H-dependent oxidoreductase subunit E, partial [Armatimonadetes bacterium]|nr:NAD(P)H-dependent oxidoreductase subunit E [Armatimonadota bacterium]
MPDLRLVDRLIEESGRRTGALIALLESFQKHFHHLPPYALERAAEVLGVSLSHIYGVATFYNAFSLKPRGQHVVKVCLGTACHVASGRLVLEEIERALGISAGETTPDGRFTIEVVHCLGACAVAPVVVTDQDLHSRMNGPKTRTVINSLVAGQGQRLERQDLLAQRRAVEAVRVAAARDLDHWQARIEDRRGGERRT